MIALRLFSTTCFLLLFALHPCFSQDFGEIKKEHLVGEAFILPGSNLFPIPNGSLDDFRKLAPQSQSLKRDYDKYQRTSYYSSNSTGFFSQAIGIDLKGRGNNASPLLRLGIIFSGGTALAENLNLNERFPYDTLVSAQTGQVFYRDSTFSETVDMTYTSQQLMLDAALIWRTNSEARWSLYGGVGLSAGVSYNNVTRIVTSQYSDIPSPGFYNPSDDDIQRRPEGETIKNDPGFMAHAYLPIGVDFRLGNKPFWQRLHVLYELRPGFTFQDIPEIKLYVSPTLAQVFGLRVVW